MSKATGSVHQGHEKIRRQEKLEQYTVYTIKVRTTESDEIVMYVGRSKCFEDRLKQHQKNSQTIARYDREKGHIKTEYEYLVCIEHKHFDDLDRAQFYERKRMIELSQKFGVSKVAGGI